MRTVGMRRVGRKSVDEELRRGARTRAGGLGEQERVAKVTEWSGGSGGTVKQWSEEISGRRKIRERRAADRGV